MKREETRWEKRRRDDRRCDAQNKTNRRIVLGRSFDHAALFRRVTEGRPKRLQQLKDGRWKQTMTFSCDQSGNLEKNKDEFFFHRRFLHLINELISTYVNPLTRNFYFLYFWLEGEIFETYRATQQSTKGP